MQLDNLFILFQFLAIPILWVVVQPIKPALAALESSINNLAQEIVGLRQQASDNRAEIAGIKEAVKDAYHRISRLESRVQELEGKCRNCTCKG